MDKVIYHYDVYICVLSVKKQEIMGYGAHLCHGAADTGGGTLGQSR